MDYSRTQNNFNNQKENEVDYFDRLNRLKSFTKDKIDDRKRRQFLTDLLERRPKYSNSGKRKAGRSVKSAKSSVKRSTNQPRSSAQHKNKAENNFDWRARLQSKER